jgi:DHA2 family multidrug resistance protein
MLDRRAQLHLTNLSGNLSSANPAFRSALQGAAGAMHARGVDAATATQKAYAMIQGLVARQATMLSYMDCFYFLGWAILLMVPMVFLIKKSKPGGGMAVH